MSKRTEKFQRDVDFREKHHHPNSTPMERAFTPGQATNNVIKTTATAIIAGGTVLLMGVYGMVNIFGGDLNQYLPMATLAASTLSTASVWIFGRPKADALYGTEINNLRNEMHHMAKEIDVLQDRILNAEHIEDFEERLARKEIGARTPSPSQTIQSDIQPETSKNAVTSSSDSMPSAQ